ncbi:MAG: hypothetical protein ACFFFG_12490 [Candidatus Thorarchaeota archaeon]
MRPRIPNLYGTISRSRKRNRRFRCISVQDIRDTDDIQLEMMHHSIVVCFFKEFRITRPMDAKRFLQCLNALTRQYEYEMLNLGRLDYFLLVPEGIELTTNSINPRI